MKFRFFFLISSICENFRILYWLEIEHILPTETRLIQLYFYSWAINDFITYHPFKCYKKLFVHYLIETTKMVPPPILFVNDLSEIIEYACLRWEKNSTPRYLHKNWQCTIPWIVSHTSIDLNWNLELYCNNYTNRFWYVLILFSCIAEIPVDFVINDWIVNFN